MQVLAIFKNELEKFLNRQSVQKSGVNTLTGQKYRKGLWMLCGWEICQLLSITNGKIEGKEQDWEGHMLHMNISVLRAARNVRGSYLRE